MSDRGHSHREGFQLGWPSRYEGLPPWPQPKAVCSGHSTREPVVSALLSMTCYGSTREPVASLRLESGSRLEMNPVPPRQAPLEADRPRGSGSSGSAFKRLVFYGSSRAAFQGLIAARGLLLASFLGPERFGMWALFRLAMLYGSFAPLGVFRGLELRVAQSRSTSDLGPLRAVEASRTALGLTLMISGAVGMGSFIVSFLVSNQTLGVGLRIFAAVVVLESLIVYGMTYLRARGNLRRYGITELVFGLVHLGLAVLLALKWGLGGALFGYLSATLCVLPMVMWQVPFRPAFSMAEARRLLQVGFPVALTSMLGFALVGVDRLVVGAYAGMTQLGFYAFAVSISGLTASFAWVVRTVVLPDLYARAEIDGSSRALRQHFSGTILPYSRFYPILVGVLAIGVGPAVSLLLPQYLEAVPASRVVIFAGVTAGFVSLGSLGVVAAGKQRVLPVLSVVLLMMNALVSYLALRLGFGILGVAVGTLLSRTAFGIGILAVNAQSAELGAVRFAFRISTPLLWCAAMVHGLDRWLGGLDLRSAGISLLAYLVLVSPLYPAALRGMGRKN